MTAADRLRQAADKLEQTAAEATPGPWEYRDPYAAGMDQPGTYGPDGQWVAECGPLRSIDAPDGRGDHDARWIAMLGPQMAGPLTAWLRERAAYSDAVGFCNDREALALADVILGGDT